MIGRFREWFARIPGDVRILIVGLLLIAPLRVTQTSMLRWMSIDGGYYTEVARHVRDGHGLVTNVSVYNFGYEQFPHATSVYPLWPLLLGYVARVVDLATAAHWLPLAFYFLAVVAAFLFGRRLWPDALFPATGLPIHGGHVAAAMLAFNRPFIFFTSLPYTEGLCWALFFLYAWRLAGQAGTPSWRWGFEQGFWLILLYFSRYQFLVLPVAVGGALALRVALGPDRMRWFGVMLASLGSFAAALGAWWIHLDSFVAHAGPLTLLRFDQNRANDLLSDFDVIVDSGSALSTVIDRLAGFGTAFQIGSGSSWIPNMGPVALGLPIAAFVVLASLSRPAPGWANRVLESVRAPKGVAWLTLGLMAAGGLLSIHLAHKHFTGSWYFGKRQGMIAILGFLIPLMFLFRRRGIPAAFAVVLLGGNIAVGTYGMVREVMSAMREARAPDKYGNLVGWLKQHSTKSEPIVVAMDEGTLRRVGWRTGNVGYHAFGPDNTWSDLEVMVRKLGVKYVILPGGKRHWAFWHGGAGRVEAMFEPLVERPSGYDILRVRDVPIVAALPKAPKVVLVGVDGATWKVMGPMVSAGQLPTFAKLYRLSASQVAFNTMSSTDSPVVWTSVATGREPRDHGVTEYVEQVEGVGKVPITSGSRKVPALWNVATNAGRTVDVVNWWASWPAEPILGTNITDHANPAAAGWMDGRYWKADPAAPAAMREDTWPTELAEALRPLWIDPARFPKEDFLARSGLTEAQWAQVEASPYNERTAYSWLKTFYTLDAPHARYAIEKLRTSPAQLTMLYLRGPDPVQHYAWNLVEPFAYATPPEELARDAGIVEGVYRYVDTWLSEVLEAAGSDATVIVVSDHGAEPCEEAKGARSKARPGCHTAAARGVLFISGPDVLPGAHLGGADPLDVAPTLAWLLGLPISKEMPGRPLTEAFRWDYAASLGRTDVETYGEREKIEAPSTASPADEQMLEQLRGLGYIQ